MLNIKNLFISEDGMSIRYHNNDGTDVRIAYFGPESLAHGISYQDRMDATKIAKEFMECYKKYHENKTD